MGTEIYFKLKQGQEKLADGMMKKMLKTLNFEELDALEEAKICNTMMEIDIMAGDNNDYTNYTD